MTTARVFLNRAQSQVVAGIAMSEDLYQWCGDENLRIGIAMQLDDVTYGHRGFERSHYQVANRMRAAGLDVTRAVAGFTFDAAALAAIPGLQSKLDTVASLPVSRWGGKFDQRELIALIRLRGGEL